MVRGASTWALLMSTDGVHFPGVPGLTLLTGVVAGKLKLVLCVNNTKIGIRVGVFIGEADNILE